MTHTKRQGIYVSETYEKALSKLEKKRPTKSDAQRLKFILQESKNNLSAAELKKVVLSNKVEKQEGNRLYRTIKKQMVPFATLVSFSCSWFLYSHNAPFNYILLTSVLSFGISILFVFFVILKRLNPFPLLLTDFKRYLKLSIYAGEHGFALDERVLPTKVLDQFELFTNRFFEYRHKPFQIGKGNTDKTREGMLFICSYAASQTQPMNFMGVIIKVVPGKSMKVTVGISPIWSVRSELSHKEKELYDFMCEHYESAMIEVLSNGYVLIAVNDSILEYKDMKKNHEKDWSFTDSIEHFDHTEPPFFELVDKVISATKR